MRKAPEKSLEPHARQRPSLEVHQHWTLELAASVHILIDEPASIVKNSCKLVNGQPFKASFCLPRDFTRDAAIFACLSRTDLTERAHIGMRKRNPISFGCKMAEQDWSAPYFPASFWGLAADLSSYVKHCCPSAHSNLHLNFISRPYNGHQVGT